MESGELRWPPEGIQKGPPQSLAAAGESWAAHRGAETGIVIWMRSEASLVPGPGLASPPPSCSLGPQEGHSQLVPASPP